MKFAQSLPHLLIHYPLLFTLYFIFCSFLFVLFLALGQKASVSRLYVSLSASPSRQEEARLESCLCIEQFRSQWKKLLSDYQLGQCGTVVRPVSSSPPSGCEFIITLSRSESFKPWGRREKNFIYLQNTNTKVQEMMWKHPKLNVQYSSYLFSRAWFMKQYPISLSSVRMSALLFLQYGCGNWLRLRWDFQVRPFCQKAYKLKSFMNILHLYSDIK
jgi:hypothetical protein